MSGRSGLGMGWVESQLGKSPWHSQTADQPTLLLGSTEDKSRDLTHREGRAKAGPDSWNFLQSVFLGLGE